MSSLILLFYSSWNDTDGKDENTIVIDKLFTSQWDIYVSLNDDGLATDSETVTTTDGLTTFVRGIDYEMDYIGGQIKVLSTGAMLDNTDYLIDYNYDETKEYDDILDASDFWDDWIKTHFISYVSSGTRISDPIDLTPVETAMDSTISWIATIPINTTLTIYTSLDDGNTWNQVTNGDMIPGITPGINLIGKKIKIKQVLTTTDSLVTPQLDSLNLEFERGLIFENQGDENCEPILYIKKIGNGDISIFNLSDDNKEFKFTSLNDNEEITVYNEEEIIESNSGSYRYDSFNDNYLSLLRGVNNLKVVGTAKIKLKYQFKRLQ